VTEQLPDECLPDCVVAALILERDVIQRYLVSSFDHFGAMNPARNSERYPGNGCQK
jgi:hypothetical protein